MKGDLNKAIFVATYLYYLNTVPLAIEIGTNRYVKTQYVFRFVH